MLSRERVIQVIQGKKPDRIPVYAWVRANNLDKKIDQAFGSVDAFEDKYEFDLAHLFGGPRSYAPKTIIQFLQRSGADAEPRAFLAEPMNDVNDMTHYQGIINGIRHHKEQRGRFVYVQTPGIFEAINEPFGIENHLAYLLLFPDDLREVYRRQAEWNRAFAMNCLDLGIDMIHVSDDWGSQRTLMFSPETFREMILPFHRPTCEAVKARGAFLSLHSDGNVTTALDGIAELGYDVLHPFQESSGMDFGVYHEKYRSMFTIMGGLDVQTTIGYGKIDFLKQEIERVLRSFPDGGLLYCTSHFIENTCSIEELTTAYDLIYELVRNP